MNKKELELYNREKRIQRGIIDSVLKKMNLYDLRSTADAMSELGYDMSAKRGNNDNLEK